MGGEEVAAPSRPRAPGGTGRARPCGVAREAPCADQWLQRLDSNQVPTCPGVAKRSDPRTDATDRYAWTRPPPGGCPRTAFANRHVMGRAHVTAAGRSAIALAAPGRFRATSRSRWQAQDEGGAANPGCRSRRPVGRCRRRDRGCATRGGPLRERGHGRCANSTVAGPAALLVADMAMSSLLRLGMMDEPRRSLMLEPRIGSRMIRIRRSV